MLAAVLYMDGKVLSSHGIHCILHHWTVVFTNVLVTCTNTTLPHNDTDSAIHLTPHHNTHTTSHSGLGGPRRKSGEGYIKEEIEG